MKKYTRVINCACSESSVSPSDLLPAGGVILDLTADGRYWRTNHIERLRIICSAEDEEDYPTYTALREETFLTESEEDEFVLLEELEVILREKKEVITYNGDAFDLPQLHAKYKAYGLKDPLMSPASRDLFRDLRPFQSILGLPGRKMSDYVEYLQRICDREWTEIFASGENMIMKRDDAIGALYLLTFDMMGGILDGDMELKNLVREGDMVIFEFEQEPGFPGKWSIHDGPFHLSTDHRKVSLGAHLQGDQLRVYHADYKDYDYLPAEGYAVHKSLSQYVDADRKEKAVRENCFHLMQFGEAFLEDREGQKRYLQSVFRYLKSR